LRVELCDDAGHTHWPEYMSDDAIREEMESYRAQGLLDLWFMERRNLVTAGEDAVFRAEMFQWYGESEARLTERGIETFLLVDPAKSASTKADETAIVAVGIDLKTGYLYVREVRVGHWHPDEIYAEIAAMVRFWGAVVVGVETASLVDFVVRPMMDYLTAHGVMIAIEPLKTNNRSKEDRIKALAPYYRQKRIFHNRVGCGALEQQLLAFPRARRDDASDAMAYVVQLLELGGRYFHPRTQHGWTREEMEACYRELERGNAPQLSDSWMAA
jgi:predicted phage terminase large subunit-like protein